jgi:hypothetical protein
MVNRKIVWTMCGVAVFVQAMLQPAGANMNPERTTFLTFSQPVRLPGVALGAGTYIFERADPIGAPTVVRVLSRDRKTAYYMGFTNFAERPRKLRHDAVVSLGESARGVTPAVTAWWPIGESTGHRFIYPAR